jgi:hypothetical protein
MNPMTGHASSHADSSTSPARLVVSWAIVLIPLAYGVYMTLTEAVALFTA